MLSSHITVHNCRAVTFPHLLSISFKLCRFSLWETLIRAKHWSLLALYNFLSPHHHLNEENSSPLSIVFVHCLYILGLVIKIFTPYIHRFAFQFSLFPTVLFFHLVCPSPSCLTPLQGFSLFVIGFFELPFYYGTHFSPSLVYVSPCSNPTQITCTQREIQNKNKYFLLISFHK